MATQVDFYHLTVMPLTRALPAIADKVLAGGGRLLVVSADTEQCAALDRLLWTFSAESFLPHGLEGQEGEADQPILIGSGTAPANAARFVALVDGQWRDDVLVFDRIFHFFEDGQIEAARTAWRTLAGREGVARRYWTQTAAGRWEQAA